MTVLSVIRPILRQESVAMQHDHTTGETNAQASSPRLTTEEARGGTGLNVVRWVLLISLALAVLALSAVWLTGAFNSAQPNSDGVVSGQATPTS
jgi:hypothetical protein